MAADSRDTIAAVATPPGRGGIGIIRLSGPDAAAIVQAVAGSLPEPRQASRARFRDRRGGVIDEGLVLFFPAPNSYTGETVLELHGHGGPVVLQALLEACLEAGARLAEPGEFTRRAFLEGKLDLAQAESVADLIDASSREAARSALRSLTGEFSARVRALVSGLVELRALVEATLDFPEEEVETLHFDDAERRLASLRHTLVSLLESSQQGAILASGVHVVIAGRPNVGKSSLLNRLAGHDRAIVTPIAGTTRDALHERLEIDGVPLTLVDTAGLRAAGDEIERLGMERTRRELTAANVVLAVFEAGRTRESIEDLPEQAVRIDVFNKADLAPGVRLPCGAHPAVLVSALTGEGIAELRAAILQAAGWHSTGETVFLARARHLAALRRAEACFAAASVAAGRWEFFAEELRLAQDSLAEITGELTADDLLGEIFARFCIGK